MAAHEYSEGTVVTADDSLDEQASAYYHAAALALSPVKAILGWPTCFLSGIVAASTTRWWCSILQLAPPICSGYVHVRNRSRNCRPGRGAEVVLPDDAALHPDSAGRYVAWAAVREQLFLGLKRDAVIPASEVRCTVYTNLPVTFVYRLTPPVSISVLHRVRCKRSVTPKWRTGGCWNE